MAYKMKSSPAKSIGLAVKAGLGAASSVLGSDRKIVKRRRKTLRNKRKVR